MKIEESSVCADMRLLIHMEACHCDKDKTIKDHLVFAYYI